MRSSALLLRAAFIFCALVLMLLLGTPGQALAAPGAASLASCDQGQLCVHVQEIAPQGTNELWVYVSVIGANGQPVTGLNQSDVQVLLDGQPAQLQELTEVTDISQPITAAVLLDTSGSMAANNKLVDAQMAIANFAGNLNNQDQVALYQVAGDGPSGVQKILDFTTDHSKLIAKVNALQANGNTPLYDAIYQVAHDMAGIQGRKLAILQTDGVDDSSQHELKDALALAEEAHLPVYTIGLGPDVNQAILQQIANSTGGNFFSNPDPATLTDSYQKILNQLRDVYRLVLDSPTPFQHGFHHVQVQVNYQGQVYKDPPDPVNLSDPHAPGNFLIPPTTYTLNFSLHKGDHVAGMTNMTLDVVKNSLPIASVSVQIDGKTILNSASGSTHYQFAWNARYILPGTHTIRITALDIEGNPETLNVQVQVGIEWGYWTGLLIQLLLLILAIVVLRYAYFRFLGGKLEGILTVYNAVDQKADIELGHDVKGSRMRLKITPSGVLIGAHPPWKKFPFQGPAKPPTEGTKDKKKKKIRALLIVQRIRPQKGTRRISVPYYQSKGRKKKRVELKDGMNRRAGDYRVDFSE